MKLLAIVRAYWNEVAEPELRAAFPALFFRLAAGLVGDGSECFRYDDLYSRDHDWGVDFFLWVDERDRDSIPDLVRWRRELFARRPPAYIPRPSRYGNQARVMTVGEFYQGLIGYPGVPGDVLQWRNAPEENYAMAVNGAVFWDGGGTFSAVRAGLQAYYPEDLRRKKIAARCMAAAQTGQYNFQRAALRKDWVTVRIVLARFAQEAMRLIYHLNRVYCPYYKWAWRGLGELPILGVQGAGLLMELAGIGGLDFNARQRQQEIIDRLCALLAEELRHQGLSDCQDWFLAGHAEAVQRTIWNRALRRLPLQSE